MATKGQLANAIGEARPRDVGGLAGEAVLARPGVRFAAVEPHAPAKSRRAVGRESLSRPWHPAAGGALPRPARSAESPSAEVVDASINASFPEPCVTRSSHHAPHGREQRIYRLATPSRQPTHAHARLDDRAAPAVRSDGPNRATG